MRLLQLTGAMQLVLLVTPLLASAQIKSCPIITSRLANGVSHSQVIALKKFLVAEGVMAPTANTTYFGPLTQAALQKWQCNKGIVCSGTPASTGYGATGPLTRAVLKNCSTILVVPPVTQSNSKPQPVPISPTPNPIPVPPPQPTPTPLPPVQCTPDSASPQKQTLSCPSGQTGSITQARTSACAPGATGPVWSEWGSVSNTCAPTINRAVKVGITYDIWQCSFQDGGVNHDIAEILAGRQSWGSDLKYHWAGKPALGYYCLTRDRDVLRKHAEELRDAGIDFVVVGNTNSYYTTYTAQHSVMNNPYWDPLNDPMVTGIQPLAALLEEWSKIPGAPKIVPWTPTKNAPPVGAKTVTGVDCPTPDFQAYWNWMLNPGDGLYKDMAFMYGGKPLWLASRGHLQDSVTSARCLNADGQHPWASDSEAIVAYSNQFTVRKMWGLIGSPEISGYSSGDWSFKENCTSGFKESGGNQACGQRVAFLNGTPEEISVSAAYQKYPGSSFISNTLDAVPKFGGKTLVRQFERFWDYPSTPIVLINGWNEWGAVRFPCYNGAFSGCQDDFFPDGNAVFMDIYGNDYDAMLEPSVRDGDKYYQILKQEIYNLKHGTGPADTQLIH